MEVRSSASVKERQNADALSLSDHTSDQRVTSATRQHWLLCVLCDCAALTLHSRQILEKEGGLGAGRGGVGGGLLINCLTYFPAVLPATFSCEMSIKWIRLVFLLGPELTVAND